MELENVTDDVCPKCKESKITEIWFNQYRCNSCDFEWSLKK